MINLRLFILGWKRQSKQILDAAGCPAWLVNWRCPSLPPVAIDVIQSWSWWDVRFPTITKEEIERRAEELENE